MCGKHPMDNPRQESPVNCFNHPDRAALGLCKSCGKGLCRDCLAELQDGLACKGRCEPRVALINRIIDSNKQVLAVARSNMRGVVILLFVMGGVFLLLGLGSLVAGHWVTAAFPLVIGLVFCLLAGSRLRPKAQFPTID